MRMPVDPGIDSAVGYQFSVFTGKGAVLHRTSMMRSHCLECRQMVCNHHNMSCRTFFNAFLNKINTVLVHPVEFFHLQQHLIELDLAEVIHPFHTEYSSSKLIRDHSVLMTKSVSSMLIIQLWHYQLNPY